MTKIEELRDLHNSAKEQKMPWLQFDTPNLGLLLDYIEAAEAYIGKPARHLHLNEIEKRRGILQAARRALGLMESN